jgi:predicted P-loop ATPase
MAQHQFNEVQDFINGLVWDGKKRLDTLFIDYLGAEDTEYTRTVTRKMFMAGIARAMHPGTKFDNMLILVGPQGIGKSTILNKMARGWFNDSICSFEGKDAAELLQGIWIVEVSELDAFRKSETSRIKQFLSLNSDIFRAAYARNAEERKRRCIFFGTTNTAEFLRDPTGERRFWPVDTGVTDAKRDVFEDLTTDEVSQIWAEARARWIAGEPLHLSAEMEKAARDKQIEHKESSAREGIIKKFVAQQVPEDWQKYTLDKRRLFWGAVESGTIPQGTKLVDRDRISAVEIWCEAFSGDLKMMRTADAREINAVLGSLPGWTRGKATIRFGPYSVQRGYIKI